MRAVLGAGKRSRLTPLADSLLPLWNRHRFANGVRRMFAGRACFLHTRVAMCHLTVMDQRTETMWNPLGCNSLLAHVRCESGEFRARLPEPIGGGGVIGILGRGDRGLLFGIFPRDTLHAAECRLRQRLPAQGTVMVKCDYRDPIVD